MSYLTDDQIKHFDAKLQAHRKQLLADISHQLNDSNNDQHIDLARQVHDRGEEAIADSMEKVNLEVIKHQLQELKDIGQALNNIDNGRYGTCEDCDGPIAVERLNANPAVIRCVECQGDWEKVH